jgi:hypothetical protein
VNSSKPQEADFVKWGFISKANGVFYCTDLNFASRPMMMQHAESSSVEDRLKRNRYNIQRTTAALDKKFTQH